MQQPLTVRQVHIKPNRIRCIYMLRTLARGLLMHRVEMMSVQNTHPGATPETADREFLDDAMLARVLQHDWRRLYPWRHHLGDDIARVLLGMSRSPLNARAAFGLISPANASHWLYRDFYLDTPPPVESIDRALGKLRRGNSAELLAALHHDDHDDRAFRRVWYEISTLTGQVQGTMLLERGSVTVPALLEVMPPSTSRPVRVRNRAMVARILRRALGEAIGVEPHRQRLLRTLGDLLADELEPPTIDNQLVILLHHLDLAPSQPLRWSQLGDRERSALRGQLRALQPRLASPPSFLAHLHDGLVSSSRQRRFLSYRLLRLDGHLDHHSHPDDHAAIL